MKQPLINPGHNACAGCGELAAVQAVMRGLDDQTIIVNATGCLEVTTTSYPETAWNLPWIHSLFENAAAVASGIRAALDSRQDHNTKVVAFGGDGATYDIGLGLISGAWERNDNFLYVCFDTEAYSNTGIQASGATPYGAETTTTPRGKENDGSTTNKKDLLDIALAHNLKYVAASTIGFPDDITNKVKRALTIAGPSYLQILCPCIPGWKIKSDQAVEMGRLAAQTGLYPLLEYVDGKLTSSSIKENFQALPVENYLGQQGRFSHISAEMIAKIKDLRDKNIERYQI